MNDSELDAKLRAAREPILPADYKEAFPQTVLANLRSNTWKKTAPRRAWLPRLAWGMAAAACLLLTFALGRWHGRMESGRDVLANAKLVGETLAMFPNRVRAIVQDEHGLQLVLSDKADVPHSTPIWIKVRQGRDWQAVVTFSGQEIQIAGQKLTVLSQPDGGIILEGNEFIWSNREPVYAARGLRIEARNLDLAAM